jgi:hemerythrin superfamily protein
MVLSDARHFLAGARTRLGDQDVMARAAKAADRLAGRGSLARLATAAAVGFVLGAGALGVRKLAMQATTGVAGDWFAALKADHKLVDTLFGLLLKTQEHETTRRHLLISKIAYALAKHQFEEEHVIYPALRDGGRAETPKHLDAEHFDMKTLMHELMELPKNDGRWLKKATALHKLIQEHVREEEEIVFPALHGRLSRAENAKLTRSMHREGLKLA